MKLYTKGMIGKRFKINYKQIDEWMMKLREEWGNSGRYGYVRILNDPYERRGIPDYVVDAYPDIHPQPVLYIIQSIRPVDVQFFMQQINLKIHLPFFPINTVSVKDREISFQEVYKILETGQSIAVNGNNLLANEVRELVLGAIERGARELIIQVKGHWAPEPYNVIEYDTAGDDQKFLEELQKKIKSLLI